MSKSVAESCPLVKDVLRFMQGLCKLCQTLNSDSSPAAPFLQTSSHQFYLVQALHYENESTI